MGKLEDLRAKSKELRDRIDAIYGEEQAVQKQISKEVWSEIQSVIRGSRWRFESGHRLTLNVEANRPLCKKIDEIWHHGYHEHIEDGVISVRFDDWEYSLVSDTPEQMTALIEKLELKIDHAAIDRKLKLLREEKVEAEREIAALELLKQRKSPE